MFSPRLTRLRAAIILAVAGFVWSDAALASFVCPHMSGCEHGMPTPTPPHIHAQEAGVGTMPCCPVKPAASISCNIGAMECCAPHHSDSDVSAVLFASDQPRPKQIAALLPPTAPAAPILTLRGVVPGFTADLAYIKPVSQKKTDLRI